MGCLLLSSSRSALRIPSRHRQPTRPGWPWAAWPSPPQLQNPCSPSRPSSSQPLPRRGPAGGCSHPFSLSDRAAVGCSPLRAAERTCTHESRVRAERWEQSPGSPDARERSDAFPHPGRIPPTSLICRVELVALAAASESCAGAAAGAVPALGLSSLCSGQAKHRQRRTSRFKVRDSK